MAQSSVAGWDLAEKAENYPKMNEILRRQFGSAASGLQKAWGRGGSQGRKAVGNWDKWFDEVAFYVTDLFHLKKLDKETQTVVLNACAAILAVEESPHWDHVSNIENLRSLLAPNQHWEDYPPRDPLDDDEEPM